MAPRFVFPVVALAGLVLLGTVRWSKAALPFSLGYFIAAGATLLVQLTVDPAIGTSWLTQ